ncbi:hypothetical protein BDV25DRAFT_6344 [Aspergillus avenaceus]|uniref:RING-type domain-containing protein n=1 Tax=Aspergillus avenaceus TaxID=36643 RepID=A0A5N6TS51_ASPAV|nr:hypothetical protein BDV25DRAFT_6344 [Aspergillus avenaceus]
MAGDPPGSEIVGVVVGAVLLFGTISLVPVLIMWHHRRRNAARRASEVHRLQTSGCMRQVTVQRWLDEQAQSDTGEQYQAQEICSICLSALNLASSSYDTLASPEPVCLPPPSPLHTLTPGPHESQHRFRSRDGDRLLILNQCHHVFHAPCLASWFAYGQYKCPICQTVYLPPG